MGWILRFFFDASGALSPLAPDAAGATFSSTLGLLSTPDEALLAGTGATVASFVAERPVMPKAGDEDMIEADEEGVAGAASAPTPADPDPEATGVAVRG